MALGAEPSTVYGLILREAGWLTGIGIFAGLIGAAVLTRVIATLLFNVSTTDAATFLTVPALLGVVALCAMVIPAWRASNVDPIVALREE